ncbi:MAG: hypothetical protein ACJ77E_14165 [Gaiellaceae bacterium]
MDVELSPPQPPEVAAAVAAVLAAALAEPARVPDPWWAQGVEEQLSA